jgi:hypothetical protein
MLLKWRKSLCRIIQPLSNKTLGGELHTCVTLLISLVLVYHFWVEWQVLSRRSYLFFKKASKAQLLKKGE